MSGGDVVFSGYGDAFGDADADADDADDADDSDDDDSQSQ
jgi:regulator of RNase E activity RraB